MTGERGVAAPGYLVMRYVRTFWSAGEKYIEFEPIVTPEMAERMRREAEAEKGLGADAQREDRSLQRKDDDRR